MSLKIDLNSVKIFQQMALDFNKLPAAEIKKIKTEFASDLKKISEDSKNLRDVDPQRSTVESVNNQINFNIVYYAVPQTTYAVNGVINKEEKTLEINFNYEFEREVKEGEQEISKKYLFTLNIKAEYEETATYSERIEKEDILKFIQRVVNEVFDTFNDEKKTLRAVILNQDDVEELAKIDSGKISNMVQTLIGAVISFAKFKEINNPNNQKVGVVLRPVRGKNIIKEFSIKKVNSFSAEIKEAEPESAKKLNTVFL